MWNIPSLPSILALIQSIITCIPSSHAGFEIGTTNTEASNENDNNIRHANGAMEKSMLSQTKNKTTPIDEVVLTQKCFTWCANALPKPCLQTQNIMCFSQKCAI